MPLSTSFVCLLTWVQRELWKLLTNVPEELGGFCLTLKYLFNAGFTADSGTRVFWERCDSTAAVEKRFHEKSSETLLMDVVSLERNGLIISSSRWAS